MIQIERRFTDEQIAQANNINIIDYAKNRGYPIKQITSHSFKISGFGGLYIDSGGLKWNRFSADIGGGTIQFVMHMENKTWVEAVKELLNIPASQYIYSSVVQEKYKENKEEKKPFKLPDKNDTYKHLFAYLIGTRKIDKQVVYDLVKSKKIYESKQKSCVFVGYDRAGGAKYAAIRGTSSSLQYRKDVAGSDKSFPFAVDIRESNACNDSTFTSNALTNDEYNTLKTRLGSFAKYQDNDILLKKGTYVNGTLSGLTPYSPGIQLSKGDAFLIYAKSSNVSNYSRVENGGVCADDDRNIYFKAKAVCRVEYIN